MQEIAAIESLRDHSKVEEYCIALKIHFSGLIVDHMDLDKEWEVIREAIIEVSKEVLGQRPCRRRQQHQSQKTKDLITEQSRVKQKTLSTEGSAVANKGVKKS